MDWMRLRLQIRKHYYYYINKNGTKKAETGPKVMVA